MTSTAWKWGGQAQRLHLWACAVRICECVDPDWGERLGCLSDSLMPASIELLVDLQ